MLKKLRTVIYHVSDLQLAKAWYRKLTGIQPYFDESFYVGFNINGCELGLDPDFADVTAKGNQAVAYWQVDNIENVVLTCTKSGAKIISAINEVGGGTKVATIEDPWGNAVGLIEEV